MPAGSLYFRLIVGRLIDEHNESSMNLPWIISREEFLEWARETDSGVQTYRSGNEEVENVNPRNLESEARGSISEGRIQGERRESRGNQKADDEVSLASNLPEDPFNRESATRKSFSEKAPFGMKDAAQFENFKKIVHQRQISGMFFC